MISASHVANHVAREVIDAINQHWGVLVALVTRAEGHHFVL